MHTSCARATAPAWSRKRRHCSPSTNCCAWPWSPPWKPARAPTSFTTALQAAKDQLTSAAGVCADQPVDLLGVIGRAVLATLLPARRPRYSARRVKCTTGRDHARPAMPTTITAITIAMRTPPLDPAPAPARPPQPPTRRQRITAIINSDPNRAWSGRELAQSLQVNLHNMLTQLSEWTRLGFLTRTGSGTYALATPP